MQSEQIICSTSLTSSAKLPLHQPGIDSDSLQVISGIQSGEFRGYPFHWGGIGCNTLSKRTMSRWEKVERG